MKILEKNDIKMSRSNTEQEDFDLLLNNEKENFDKNFYNNYSKKAIEEYSLKKFDLADNYCLLLLPGNIFFMILAGLFFKNTIDTPTLYSFLFLLSLLSVGAGFHCLSFLSPVKKIMNKILYKKEKNIKIIKKDIFYNITPDNHFLKHFINAYGEKAIKNILIDKENITYGDIENYITKFKEEEKIRNNQKSKIDKVDEIVKCISAL